MNTPSYPGLTAEQQHQLNNILASAEIEGTPVSDETITLIVQQIQGERSPQEVIQTIIARYQGI